MLRAGTRGGSEGQESGEALSRRGQEARSRAERGKSLEISITTTFRIDDGARNRPVPIASVRRLAKVALRNRRHRAEIRRAPAIWGREPGASVKPLPSLLSYSSAMVLTHPTSERQTMATTTNLYSDSDSDSDSGSEGALESLLPLYRRTV